MFIGGKADEFYKAIEAKSVSTEGANHVELAIKTAMGQLCGIGHNGGHVTPAPKRAVRVIDVVVLNDQNAFPVRELNICF